MLFGSGEVMSTPRGSGTLPLLRSGLGRAGNAGREVPVRGEAVQAGVAVGDRQREASAHWTRPGQRVESLAIAGTQAPSSR